MKLKDMVMSAMCQGTIANVSSGEELWNQLQRLLIRQFAWYVIIREQRSIRAITIHVKENKENGTITIAKVLELNDKDFNKEIVTWHVGDKGIEFLNNYTREMENWAKNEGLVFCNDTELEGFYFCMPIMGEYEL